MGFGIFFYYNSSIMPPRWGLGIVFHYNSSIMSPLRGYNHVNPLGFGESIFITILALCHPFGIPTVSPRRGLGIVFHYNFSILSALWGYNHVNPLGFGESFFITILALCRPFGVTIMSTRWGLGNRFSLQF